MRSIAIAALIVVAAGATAGACSEQPVSVGEREFRAAWVSFTAPVQVPPEARTPDGQRQARATAIEHIEAAVKADPSNAVYHAALAQMSVVAEQYARAKEAVDRAIELTESDPLLYLLRGEVEVALARMEPEKVGERIEPALKAFDDAARLDPENGLPLLLGASVAFEVGREDLALPRIKQALGRQWTVLGRMPVPFDLYPDRKAAIDAWRYVQYSQWMAMLARCENAAGGVLRIGERKLKAGDPEGAEADFREALAIGRMVGMSEPSLFITTNTAINMMENAYAGLLRVAEAQESREAERWRGETGVLYIGRADLYSRLQTYLKNLDEEPPGSAEELLRLEAAAVEHTVLGIGLTPPSDRRAAEAKPSDSPAEQASAAE